MGNRGRSNKPASDYRFSNAFFNQGTTDTPGGYSLAGIIPQQFKDQSRLTAFGNVAKNVYSSQNDLLLALQDNSLLNQETAQYIREQAATANTPDQRDQVYGLLVQSITGNSEDPNGYYTKTLMDLQKRADIKAKIKDQPGLRSQTLLGANFKSVPGKKDTLTDGVPQ